METTQKPYAFSRKVFCEGMRDGVPIALGYFAVSFSLALWPRNLPQARHSSTGSSSATMSPTSCLASRLHGPAI